MQIDKIPVGDNPPDSLNVIIEVPVGGEPVKYEFDKASGLSSVHVENIVRAGNAPVKRYDPSNPMADKDGNVFEAAVDETRELVDMLESARTYQNNVEVMQTAKSLIIDTLKLGR